MGVPFPEGEGALTYPCQPCEGEGTGGGKGAHSTAKLLIASPVSKREETMKADSLREPGLWGFFCASRPRRLLGDTAGKFSRKPEGKAVCGISEQSKTAQRWHSSCSPI